jgi:hypothetical protein
MTDHRALGDFHEKALVGWFDPRIADVAPGTEKFGLGLQVQYFYGGFRDDEGNLYVLERKFIGPMTSGLWLMTNRDAPHMKLTSTALSTSRGEIRRHFTPESHRYADALMAKVGKDLVSGEQHPLDLTFTDGGVSWTEGDLLSVEATPVGTGLMHYSPMPQDSLLYTMQANRAEGTVMGRPATGFVLIDHGFWPQGPEWKEHRFFSTSQVSWNVFANEYDDGTVDAGFFICGLNDFAVAGVFDNKGPRVATSELEASLTLADEDWMGSATYRAGGEEWVFTPEPAGRMNEFTAARWAGYRAQAGVTRRAGNTRGLRASFTWLEFFPDRARAGGYAQG